MSLERIDTLFNFEKGIIQSSKCIPGKYDFITASAEWKTHNEYSFDCEALIFAAAASGSLGRTHYVNGKFISSDLCFIITPKDQEKYPIDLRFYHILFNELKNDIVKNTKAGTSKEAIGLTAFGRYELPYIDIDKQIEIKNQFVNAEETKEKLTIELIHQSDLVKCLRQQLLQDAVQGKLIPQNPKDETASELLKKIKVEKEKLIKEKKLKKLKDLPPISEDEISFNIPSNWCWVRFQELLEYANDAMRRGPFGSSITKAMFVPISDNSTKVYEQKNAIYKSYEIGNYYIDLETHPNLESFLAYPGDIIISCAGTIGETYILPKEAPIGIINQALLKIKLNNKIISNEYFLNVFKSLIKGRVNDDAKGSAMKNLGSISYLKENLIIPLPPLAEQQRIVQKLEQLMQTCDALQQSIQTSKSQTEKLLQQVLREALQPKKEVTNV